MSAKIFTIIFIIIIIGIQFIRPEKNISVTPSPSNIASVYAVPQNVDTLLRRSCYDCHSNNTKYPWYFNIQPVAWWMSNHIQSGKKHLNFDAFTSYPISKQYKKLDDIVDEIKQGDMPLPSYTFQHKEARLTDADKQSIYLLCDSIQATIRTKYPPDSLIIKKK